MASGIQVKNGKAFDFNKMIVNWEGNQYPFRELVFEDASFCTFVSVAALESKLINDNGEPVNRKAEWLDNQIVFYVDSVDQLNLSNNDLYNLVYTK